MFEYLIAHWNDRLMWRNMVLPHTRPLLLLVIIFISLQGTHAYTLWSLVAPNITVGMCGPIVTPTCVNLSQTTYQFTLTYSNSGTIAIPEICGPVIIASRTRAIHPLIMVDDASATGDTGSDTLVLCPGMSRTVTIHGYGSVSVDVYPLTVTPIAGTPSTMTVNGPAVLNITYPSLITGCATTTPTDGYFVGNQLFAASGTVSLTDACAYQIATKYIAQIPFNPSYYSSSIQCGMSQPTPVSLQISINNTRYFVSPLNVAGNCILVSGSLPLAVPLSLVTSSPIDSATASNYVRWGYTAHTRSEMAELNFELWLPWYNVNSTGIPCSPCADALIKNIATTTPTVTPTMSSLERAVYMCGDDLTCITQVITVNISAYARASNLTKVSYKLHPACTDACPMVITTYSGLTNCTCARLTRIIAMENTSAINWVALYEDILGLNETGKATVLNTIITQTINPIEYYNQIESQCNSNASSNLLVWNRDIVAPATFDGWLIYSANNIAFSVYSYYNSSWVQLAESDPTAAPIVTVCEGVCVNYTVFPFLVTGGIPPMQCVPCSQPKPIDAPSECINGSYVTFPYISFLNSILTYVNYSNASATITQPTSVLNGLVLNSLSVESTTLTIGSNITLVGSLVMTGESTLVVDGGLLVAGCVTIANGTSLVVPAVNQTLIRYSSNDTCTYGEFTNVTYIGLGPCDVPTIIYSEQEIASYVVPSGCSVGSPESETTIDYLMIGTVVGGVIVAVVIAVVLITVFRKAIFPYRDRKRVAITRGRRQ